MHAHKQEGVIKFRLDFQPADAALIRDFSIFSALNQCRSELWKLKMLGQDDKRYDGLGYGNVSSRVRISGAKQTFLITGTQTGHLARMSAKHYALVTDFDLQRNTLCAKGPCEPSSEAMTHAAIYQQLTEVNAVIHGHCPEIWQHAGRLALACTAAEIPYGTPEMAQAIQDLLISGKLSADTIVMAGHEDGFITWGNSLQSALHQVKKLLGRVASR